jgi:hypothetical protein
LRTGELIKKTFMKKIVAATIVIVALVLDSCEPAATFDKPQPDNIKSLTSFPERLQGRYLADDLTSIVTITDKLITRHYDYDYKVFKDSIGSSYKIAGDTLINLTEGTKEKILLKGDSVTLHANWKDTLFNISADNVLKKFKGYYFLNNRYDDNVWEVKELSLTKGVLTVGSISDTIDIQRLKEITETTADTISTQFSLTRRQFKKFVSQNGFGDQETFTRVTEKDR